MKIKKQELLEAIEVILDNMCIDNYKDDVLLKLLQDKGIITKEEFNKTLEEQSIIRQQANDENIERVKKLSELAKMI